MDGGQGTAEQGVIISYETFTHLYTFRVYWGDRGQGTGVRGDRGQGLGGTGVRGDKGLSYHMRHSHTFRVWGPGAGARGDRG